MSQFHLDLEVHDRRALLDAALHRLIEDGVDPQDARNTLCHEYVPEGIDVSACLIALLDPGSVPGISINESWVDPL